MSGDTTIGQNGPENDGNDRPHRIPKSSSITEASLSDCLVSYSVDSLGEPYSTTEISHIVGGSYPSAEVQSTYSTVPARLIAWKIFL